MIPGELLRERVPMPPHLTMPQAAALLGVDEGEVSRLLEEGLLSHTPYGIPTCEVAELLSLREAERAASPPS